MITPVRPSASTAAAAALGFKDQHEEINVDALPVDGTIPEWLTGALLRNGPARWDLNNGSVNHWFDGMAMLHRFSFADGTVSYANRKLRGKAAAGFDDGKLAFREFASDPCRSMFGRFMSLFTPGITDNGAVNITKIGEEWLAVTESPMAVAFDPATLESIGVRAVAKGARIPVAHPHYDDATGELIGLRTAMGRVPTFEVTATDSAGSERLIGTIPVKRAAYQHSFGLTDRFAVVGEHPLVVNPLSILLSGKPFIENFSWEPERGTRFSAIDRKTGAVTSWTAPASFCFHHVNAFDDADGSIVIDLAIFEDASIIDSLRLDHRRAGQPSPPAFLTRYRLTPGRPDAVQEDMPVARIELPRIDERFARKPYSVVYADGFGDEESTFFDSIVRVDLSSGTVDRWHEPGSVPGEPVFVPRPGSDVEGDGVVLSVLLEPAREASSLLVLDGETLAEIGRARVPQHIPLGFHGGYSRSL